MTSRKLVLDEWILHDLRGDNGREAQKEVMTFLEKLEKKCDKIVVLKASPWMKKFYQMLMKSNDSRIRGLSKYLRGHILLNPLKCCLLGSSEVQSLSSNLEETVPVEDIYLVKTYLSANANIIITTDTKLCDAVSTCAEIRISTKENFLRDYVTDC